MRILPSLAAVLLVLSSCVPANAAPPPVRNIMVPCRLTTAALGLTGQQNPTQGRGFSLHVMNGTTRAISLPATPRFGWRLEARTQRRWTLQAEGGPVHLLRGGDSHLAISSPPGDAASPAMVQIPPGGSRDFHFFLPEADGDLRPLSAGPTPFRLSVYWAASPALQRADPNSLPCAIAATWSVTLSPTAR